MKKSLYNSIIFIDKSHMIIYNSLSGKFIVAKNCTFDINKLTIEELERNHPALYKQMCDGNMIVEDNFDEVTVLLNRVESADNNYDNFILHINPTLDCNFNCWYCYEKHIRGSRLSNDRVENIKNLITNIFSKPEIKYINLGFFGGEPFMYFNNTSKHIIEHANSLSVKTSKDLTVQFTTNGSLLNDSIIEYLSKFKCSFQITLDGYKDIHDSTRHYRNNNGSYEKIIGNIKKSCSAGIKVIIRINYTNDNVDSVAYIMSDFFSIDKSERDRLYFDFQRVWQERKDRGDKTELKMKEIRKKFRKEGFIVLANYIPQDVRRSCYGDKRNYAIINYNGDVFGCTARDFTKDCRIGVLDSEGNIVYDEEKLNMRNKAKLYKNECKVCRIAPLCGGGCRQRAFESMTTKGCSMRYSEKDIEEIITDIFEYEFNL